MEGATTTTLYLLSRKTDSAYEKSLSPDISKIVVFAGLIGLSIANVSMSTISIWSATSLHPLWGQSIILTLGEFGIGFQNLDGPKLVSNISNPLNDLVARNTGRNGTILIVPEDRYLSCFLHFIKVRDREGDRERRGNKLRAQLSLAYLFSCRLRLMNCRE